MNFDEQEQKIIDYGLQNNKSQDEVEKAIVNYRQTKLNAGGSTGLIGVGSGFLKSATQTLQNIGKGTLEALTFGKADTENLGFSEQSLERRGGAEKLGGFLSEVAQYAIPATKVSKFTKGAGVLKNIGGQVASDIGVGLAQTGSAKEAGQIGLVSAGISSIPILGKIIPDNLINKISGVSKKIEEINLRLTPPQKLQLEKGANDVTSYLSKLKLTGSPKARYNKISSVVDDFENQIQTKLKESGKEYTKDEIIGAVKNIPDNFLDEVANPEVYNEMVRRTDDFVDFITKQKGDTVSAARVNEFKRNYAKNARNKAGDTVTNEAREAISDGIYDLLQKDIKSLKPINKEYGKALVGQKLIGKAIGRNELGLIGNLIGIATGTSLGASLGGGLGAAAGAAAGPQIGKVVAGTRTRSQIGAGLQKLADYLNNPQVDNVGNVIIPKSIIDSIVND